MRTLISYIILCFVCFAFLCVQMFSLLSIFKKQANFSLLHIFYLCPFYSILWKYVQLLWTLICYIISCFVWLALRTNVLIALHLYKASQIFLVTSFLHLSPLLHIVWKYVQLFTTIERTFKLGKYVIKLSFS